MPSEKRRAGFCRHTHFSEAEGQQTFVSHGKQHFHAGDQLLVPYSQHQAICGVLVRYLCRVLFLLLIEKPGSFCPRGHEAARTEDGKTIPHVLAYTLFSRGDKKKEKKNERRKFQRLAET
jgi:hypothetical protein